MLTFLSTLLNRRFRVSFLLLQGSKGQWRKYATIFLLVSFSDVRWYCRAIYCIAVIIRIQKILYLEHQRAPIKKTRKKIVTSCLHWSFERGEDSPKRHFKSRERKVSNKSFFIGNDLFIYPWTTFHSILNFIHHNIEYNKYMVLINKMTKVIFVK